MIIRKMTASFGRLENETLELENGLNIITAANESGKSTWCAFIRAMLYGIDSSQREKGGVKPDKLLYAPWSGAAMAGSMEIEQEGKSITLSRSTKSAGAPMREFSAVYTGTAEPVGGLTGRDAGEMLTAMPRAVFDSSVFVRQSSLPVQNGPELEKRIDSIIASGGDEGVGFTDADAALRAWQRKRRHNNSGAIPALEADIAALDRDLDSILSLCTQAQELEQEISRAEASCAQMEEQSRLEGQNRREKRLDELEALRKDAMQAESESLEAQRRETELRRELDESVFAGQSADELEKNMLPDIDEYARRYARQLPRWLVFAFLILGLGGCMCAGSFGMSWLYIVGGIGFVAAIVCAVIWRYRDNHYVGWGKMLEGKYGSGDIDQLRGIMKLYREKWDALSAASEAAARCRDKADAASRRLRRAEQELVAPAMEEGDAAARAREELEQLRRRHSGMLGRIEATADPVAAKSEKLRLEQRLEELRGQYDALALAIDTLRQSAEEIQQRFSPRLGKRASEIMQRLTGGKYEALSFSRTLSATAARPGDSIAHEAAFLSGGTADQLYLSLRLAICELALPEGCSCPLILDDALVNFDDERMGLALELLEEISRTRQVILFSCHDCEENYIKNRRAEKGGAI